MFITDLDFQILSSPLRIRFFPVAVVDFGDFGFDNDAADFLHNGRRDKDLLPNHGIPLVVRVVGVPQGPTGHQLKLHILMTKLTLVTHIISNVELIMSGSYRGIRHGRRQKIPGEFDVLWDKKTDKCTKKDPERMEIGENGAKELVALLVHRGYFHDNQEPVVEHDPQDSEDFMMAIQKEAGNIFSMDDADCMLVATRDGNFMTRASLRQKLLDSISRNGGRVSRQNLAAESAVTVEQVQRTLVGCEELREVGGDVLSPQFFDEVVPRLYLWLETNGGLMSLSELSHRLDVTFNSLEDAFKSRLDRINARMTTINGATVVINQTYETRQKFRIQGVFCALSEPTMVGVRSVSHKLFV